MKRRSYVWAAFTARPLGMPVPPNLFGLAAFALLGTFLNPGFYLLGLGLEIAYLYLLSQNPRFRQAVDAGARAEDPAERRYRTLLDQLDAAQQQRQREIEARAREILASLDRSPLLAPHRDSLQQLVWLHLRLLAARTALLGVVSTASHEQAELEALERRIEERLASGSLTPELRRSLEQQKTVIDQRQQAHEDARRRLEHVDAELGRIDQQIALIREQALLAADDEHIGASLDALAASFNEASRWLGSQRDLLASLDLATDARLPASVLEGPPPAPARSRARVAQ